MGFRKKKESAEKKLARFNRAMSGDSDALFEVMIDFEMITQREFQEVSKRACENREFRPSNTHADDTPPR